MTKPLSRPWTRRPKEPANWYARFDAYLSLGPARSLESAFRKCRETDPDLSADRPGAQWYAIARTWEWEDRAHAYDEQNRLRIRADDAARAVGKPLNLLVAEYSEAVALLPAGISLKEAVREFARRSAEVRSPRSACSWPSGLRRF